MKTYLKEKIGNPELFVGRKRELSHFLNWTWRIKREISLSTAILSRRKTGKSALMQRLYNQIFEKNQGVIPFYYEIIEGKQWVVEFCQDFYLTFIYQYIAFITRKTEYVKMSQSSHKTFSEAVNGALEIGGFLADDVKKVERLVRERRAGLLWAAVRDTPRTLANRQNEFIVQMIDEFQFLNSEIYWDEARTNQASDFAAGYLHTVEYKNAPLLIAGSWIGWLMNDLNTMLPGRFQYHYMENLPEDECVEMIFRYALIEDMRITEETACLMAQMTEGNPFYISAVFRSQYPDKDLTTEEGLRKTIEFETLHSAGIIRGTWLEYINSAFPRINEKYAKDIVIYLSKHRDCFISRSDLKKHLNLDIPDYMLDKRMDALLKSDIIEENRFRYRGVQDNIFDKVFRSRYADDIDKFVTEEASNEYKALFEKSQVKYKGLSGEHNRYKGAFAEFVISHHLSYAANTKNKLFRGMMRNLPDDFRFAEYESVRPYHSPPLYKPEFQLDIFAMAKEEEYSLIWEVKHRKTTKFSLVEAKEFMRKAQKLVRLEGIGKYALFVFSSAGFTRETPDWLKSNGIAWSEDGRWIDTHILRNADEITSA